MVADTDSRLSNGDHVVQFYDGDDELVGMVGGYLAASVLDGDAVVVVATPGHIGAFSAALVRAGVDVETACARGDLTVLDADETMARFMLDGSPDVGRFDEVVGGLITSKAAGERQVRVYGEMVALLWERGNVAGAVELETLWNELGARMPFSLFCAYPASIASDPVAADAFADVCHLHSTIVETESPRPGPVGRRFAGTFETIGGARRFVTDTLRTWKRSDLVDDAILVVSELVTNAVRHAGSGFAVVMTPSGGGVRVAVTDSSAMVPLAREAGSPAPGGRGLPLIASLADQWGHVAVHGGGKVVWAELSGR